MNKGGPRRGSNDKKGVSRNDFWLWRDAPYFTVRRKARNEGKMRKMWK